MSNAAKLAGAFGLAVLACSTPTLAQDYPRQLYQSDGYPDCYYDISPDCSGPTAYGTAAYAPVVPGPFNAFAAIGGIVQPPPAPVATRLFPPSLRGGDFVAVHGSGP